MPKMIFVMSRCCSSSIARVAFFLVVVAGLQSFGHLGALGRSADSQRCNSSNVDGMRSSGNGSESERIRGGSSSRARSARPMPAARSASGSGSGFGLIVAAGSCPAGRPRTDLNGSAFWRWPADRIAKLGPRRLRAWRRCFAPDSPGRPGPAEAWRHASSAGAALARLAAASARSAAPLRTCHFNLVPETLVDAVRRVPARHCAVAAKRNPVATAGAIAPQPSSCRPKCVRCCNWALPA